MSKHKEPMEAVILAGGRGTRLRPYTTAIPKPLVPVGDQPILAIVLRQLKAAGVAKVTLTVSHLAEIIMAVFGDGRKYGLEIAYSVEDKPLSTVGPLKLVKDLPERFIVMNGDLLTDVDYRAVYESHIKAGCELTITTFKRDAKIDLGVIEVDEKTLRAVGFREKPTYHFNVSTGVYVYNRTLLDRVPSDSAYGLDNLVLDMLKDKIPINTYPHHGYWLDIGRPEDYEKANQDAEKLLNEHPERVEGARKI